MSLTPVFSSRMKSPVHPPYEIFFITIQNSTKKILKDLSFYIKTPGTSNFALTRDEIIRECSSSTYAGTNMGAIFSLRRLLIQDYILNDIDFEKSTAGSAFPFILPLERGSVFVALRIPPFEYRSYTLSVEYRSGNDKKIVDFEIVRKENRSD